jgi:chemotaxis protein CheD
MVRETPEIMKMVTMKKIVDVFTGEVEVRIEDIILKSSAIGSCIVIIAYNQKKKVGGLAHVMVGGTSPVGSVTQKTRYAYNAIEELVVRMKGFGVESNEIETCLVGGGNLLKRKDDTICEMNISSVIGIFKEKNIPIQKMDIRGTERRSASLHIQTGRVYFSVGNSKEKLLWKFSSPTKDKKGGN